MVAASATLDICRCGTKAEATGALASLYSLWANRAEAELESVFQVKLPIKGKRGVGYTFSSRSVVAKRHGDGDDSAAMAVRRLAAWLGIISKRLHDQLEASKCISRTQLVDMAKQLRRYLRKDPVSKKGHVGYGLACRAAAFLDKAAGIGQGTPMADLQALKADLDKLLVQVCSLRSKTEAFEKKEACAAWAEWVETSLQKGHLQPTGGPSCLWSGGQWL